MVWFAKNFKYMFYFIKINNFGDPCTATLQTNSNETKKDGVVGSPPL